MPCQTIGSVLPDNIRCVEAESYILLNVSHAFTFAGSGKSPVTRVGSFQGLGTCTRSVATGGGMGIIRSTPAFLANASINLSTRSQSRLWRVRSTAISSLSTFISSSCNASRLDCKNTIRPPQPRYPWPGLWPVHLTPYGGHGVYHLGQSSWAYGSLCRQSPSCWLCRRIGGLLCVELPSRHA